MSERQPFKAVLEHDYNMLFGLRKQALFELAFASHTGPVCAIGPDHAAFAIIQFRTCWLAARSRV